MIRELISPKGFPYINNEFREPFTVKKIEDRRKRGLRTHYGILIQILEG